MVTFFETLPAREPRLSICFTRSEPSTTSPNTTWAPSSHEVTTVVMKNWEPLLENVLVIGIGEKLNGIAYVFFPALAMESKYGLSCLSLKFSS